jgi:hypothetical protein
MLDEISFDLPQRDEDSNSDNSSLRDVLSDVDSMTTSNQSLGVT